MLAEKRALDKLTLAEWSAVCREHGTTDKTVIAMTIAKRKLRANGTLDGMIADIIQAARPRPENN